MPKAVGNATEQMISTALPNYRWPAPTAALMTLCEVMTWIAFGEAVPKQRLSKNEWSRLLPHFNQTSSTGRRLPTRCWIERNQKWRKRPAPASSN